jgi:hypothetical protein
MTARIVYLNAPDLAIPADDLGEVSGRGNTLVRDAYRKAGEPVPDGGLWERLAEQADGYTLTDAGERIAADSVNRDIETWTDRPTDNCYATRPGTLGYQRCVRPGTHEGSHRSPDGGRWTTHEAR